MCTIWKHLIRGTRKELENILRPHQVAVGVKGGLSILIHGMRLLMQQNPDHMFVKIDLRNAFNKVERAAMLGAIRSHPALDSLVPMFEKTYVHETMAFVGREKRTLFGVEDEGDVSQGGPQGNPGMPAAFCPAIHPAVKKLHENLQRGDDKGSCAIDMDDGYMEGPPDTVFPALEEFLRDLRKIGLNARLDKFAAISPNLDLSEHPERRKLWIPLQPYGEP